MLRNLNEIRGYRLEAPDGIIGSCKDFLFAYESRLYDYYGRPVT